MQGCRYCMWKLEANNTWQDNIYSSPVLGAVQDKNVVYELNHTQLEQVASEISIRK